MTSIMKLPIALLINDIHISKDNISEFNKNWDEALEICKKNNILDIVIGGDLFTSRSSQTLATLLAVKNAFEKAVTNDIYITIAEGNHDLVDQEAFEGYNHLWAGQKGIEVIDVYRSLIWEDCDFALLVMSYFPEDGSFLERLWKSTEEFLSNNKGMTRNDIVLYIHEGVHGALGDFEIPGEIPQEPLLDYKAVLCGHYHNRVRIKNTNIEYIGSSRQHNFGEDEEKGYTILYSDGSYSFVKNGVNIRYKTYEINADQINDISLDNDERYKYKIKVHCNEKQAKLFDKQRLLDLGFHKVEVVSETIISQETASSAIQEKYDKQGICQEYQNYCNENAIDSQLGLKYLEN